MLRALPFAIALLLIAFARSTQAAPPLPEVAVTTCGQIVPPKTLGYLTGDLDCTGFTGRPPNVGQYEYGAAVYLDRKAKLDLRGFTLTGGYNGVLCNALTCDPKGRPCSKNACEVFGGTIVANGNTSRGVGGFQPIVHDVTITGFSNGVYAYRKARVTRATISDSPMFGVAGKSLVVTDCTITNNGSFGVSQNNTVGNLRLTGSTVTGNGTNPYCGLNPCADVYAARPPRVTDTVCDTSMAYPSGNWNICALD